MLLQPTLEDARRIVADLGRVLAVVAAAGSIPLVWAVALREWGPAGDLLLMMGIAGAQPRLDAGLGSTLQHAETRGAGT